MTGLSRYGEKLEAVVYATCEGVLMQVVAGVFVIGSYVMAEQLQKRRLTQCI